MQEPDFFSHPSAVIDEGCKIGTGTKIWHFSHIMSNCQIGERCNIGQNCVIAPEVVLGNNVKIQNNVSVYAGVVCEDDVFLGPSMVFTNILNPRSAVVRKNQYLKTLVRKGASIGANSTILCGIEIGKYALIGAGAVVTKDVKPYALVKGNPAKQAGWVSEYGHKLDFDKNGLATCHEEKSHYRLDSGQCVRIS
jgi:UDP-2-acetamido-3-amino-2,3-dideoxy-glucuronate N-acetyltransferase